MLDSNHNAHDIRIWAIVEIPAARKSDWGREWTALDDPARTPGIPASPAAGPWRERLSPQISQGARWPERYRGRPRDFASRSFPTRARRQLCADRVNTYGDALRRAS